MARRFNGTSDRVKFNPGGCSAAGESTTAIMFKRNDRSAGHWHALISMIKGTTDAGAENYTTEITASDYGTTDSHDQPTLDTAGGFIDALNTVSHIGNTTDWWILAISHPAGTTIPRVHLKNFTLATAWVHIDMTGSIPFGSATSGSWEIRIGSFQATDWLNGDVTLAAWWNSNLSDAQVAAALTGNYADWLAGTGGAGAPQTLWPLGNTALLGTAGASIPDVLGTATWKSTDGTSLVADPAGWSWGSTPQELAPTSDISAGNWTPSTGATLFGTIDELTASDTDYDQSGLSPVSADVMRVKFQAGGNPGTTNDGANFHVKYRLGKSSTGGDQIDMTVKLYQGASLIHTWTHTNVDALTTFDQTLTNGEYNSITDYSDLYVEVSSIKV